MTRDRSRSWRLRNLPQMMAQPPGNRRRNPGPQAPAKPAQTAEENARFAQFRREAQAARREAEQARAAAQRAQNVLNRYGYQGDNLDEVLDTLEAAQRNISVSELRQERAAEEERFRQAMQNAPEVVQMRQQLAEYQRREDQRILDDDLGEIKRLNPGRRQKACWIWGRSSSPYARPGWIRRPLTTQLARRGSRTPSLRRPRLAR